MGQHLSARKWLPFIAVALTLSLSSSAVFATAVAWTNEDGSNARFGWNSGQSDDGGLEQGGLWGDPVVSLQRFDFDAMHNLFYAETTAPASVSIASAMSVTMDTTAADAPAAPLTEVHFFEWGTYTGDAADLAAGTYGTMLLIPVTPGFPQYIPHSVDLTFDFNEVNHTWTAWADLDFTSPPPLFPSAVTVLGIDITNHLHATPDSGTASIQKLGATVTVPEPSTGLLVLIGLAAVVRRGGRSG